MIKSIDDVQKLGQTSVDNSMKLYGEWTKGWQVIATAMTDYTKRSYEDGTQTMEKLVGAFNPAAVDGLMCRNTLSVGFDGRLFDCDFNQMLELAVTDEQGRARTIHDVTRADLEGRAIFTAPHCYGCTAGAGSSCGGATVKS